MPFTVSDESAADVFVTNLLVAVFSSISVRPVQTTPLGVVVSALVTVTLTNVAPTGAKS